ncbi:hypothetical protein FOB58_003980 [Candida parapsilosis]|uniref:Uncharacterized protein n=2 Tax=Candida parapsilosis TaxID=5480 RepID=G8B9V6_CANPC|nr:uncharacterized protein CPAR2_303970 [Candida parapsilosis]KAF6044341.1 hypothetical protein FOB60_005434 [Candida parapsilosis]KAF6047902.1 hypothetical protein FOB58_003980 [Candida parapsilosis]KAF6050131.1 hypothetical protein FOB59_002377 [Candida parapsilosis]KAF6061251.1 hypothetical protein FOB61_004008 [Candida parapsilosis]KAI5904642.1 hypothetical protein K4G60_g3800 [Candida parapsilosis]
MSQGAPMTHKFIVGTIAILLGGYVTYKAGSDFQFVKFEPHSPEEVARRKREKIPTRMEVLESATLDLTPEAKERIGKKMLLKQSQEQHVEKERMKRQLEQESSSPK